MIGIVFFAIELGNNLMGPNVVFYNILKSLATYSDLSTRLKYFFVFNKDYKKSDLFNLINSIGEIIFVNVKSYVTLFSDVYVLKKQIINKYKHIKLRFLYPKPILLPVNVEQYAFLYDLPFELLYFGKTIKYIKQQLLFKRIIWNRLKKIFTISHSSFNDIKSLLGLKNVDWIHLGVDQEIFRILPEKDYKPYVDSIFRSRGIDVYDGYFFYPLGKIWRRKNLENLIYAFRILHQTLDQKIYLVITANNLDSQDSYVRKVLSIPCQEVIWIKTLSTDDLVKLYNGSLAVVYPSFYEGFGLPIIESLSCGKNILCSNINVFKEIYPDNEFLFEPNNVEDIYKCMLNFYYKKDKLVTNRILLREKATRFSWKNTVDNLITKMGE
ncbi:MAG: glycosyltransferase family 1 protein [bacterium]